MTTRPNAELLMRLAEYVRHRNSELANLLCDAANAILAAAAPDATPFRTITDGATFEDYRDGLAVGTLTNVDQMAFDNVLHDRFFSEADATPGQGAGRELRWRSVSEVPKCGGTYFVGGYTPFGAFDFGFATLIITVDGPEWTRRDQGWHTVEYWCDLPFHPNYKTPQPTKPEAALSKSQIKRHAVLDAAQPGQGEAVSKEQALLALNDMDDFARMANITATGPLSVLAKFINQATPSPVRSSDEARLDWLIERSFTVAQLRDTGQFMVKDSAGYPVTGNEHENARIAIDETMEIYPARNRGTAEGGA